MARHRRDSKGRFLKTGRRARRGRAKTYRRRNAAHRVSRRHHRRRHFRRNPPSVKAMGRGLLGVVPAPKRIIAGMAGAALTRLIPGQLGKFLPQLPLSDAGGLAVKAAAAVGSGLLLRGFIGKAAADDLVFGGLVTVGDEAARLYLYPSIGMPVSAYLPPELSAYIDERPTMAGRPQLGWGEGGEFDYEDYAPAYAET